MRTGRPTMFTPELAEEILFKLSNGELLLDICRADHMPHRVTVYKWTVKHPEFGNRYAEAFRDQQVSLTEESIAELRKAGDKVSVMRAAALSRHLEWRAERLNQALFGKRDQLDVNVSRMDQLSDGELLREAGINAPDRQPASGPH